MKKINKISNSLKKNLRKEYYRLDRLKLKNNELKFKAQKLINEIGFCVIDNVITGNLDKYVNEIEKANFKIKANTELFKKLIKKGLSEESLLNHPILEVRKSKFRSRKSKLVNDIFWMPKFSKKLGDKGITDIIKFILDDHVRIGQLHSKIGINQNINSRKNKITNDKFGLPRVKSGDLNSREWHTDWPHDPWAYSKNRSENIGCVKEPFPDLTMGLVVIHYLTDPKDVGGTWVVPASHKSGFSPRHGKISISLPLKNEHQVKAKAGSVFLQDTRLWHSSPVLSNSIAKRVTIVSRWYPWWLELDDYAPDSRFNIVARPLSLKDIKKLPKNLKSYFIHLCFEKKEYINRKLILRTKSFLKKSIKLLR